MKILIVSQYFWPETFRINDLAVSLVKRGHKVSVLAGTPNYPEGKFFPGYGLTTNHQSYRGVDIVRVPIVPRGKDSKTRLAFNYMSYVASSLLLGPFWCRDDYDIILVFQMSPVTMGIPAILMKKLRHIPMVFWVQDLWPESVSAVGAIKSRTVLKILEKMVDFIYSQCDRILVQSRSFCKPIERFGIQSDEISYFPNSAEELYRPLTLDHDAEERALVPSGFNIMFAGNIGVAQDFATILDAAERLKDHTDINWVILGDGRMRPWVESEIKRRGLENNFHLLGKYPVETMPRFFSLADVLLVTLTKKPVFALTIPSKIQSYLACGKPIVASLEGEGAQVVEDSKSGVSCSPESSEALASAVMKVYDMSREDRDRMGMAGRKYFEANFEGEMLLDNLESWMNELIHNPKEKAGTLAR